jgi:hypothetical protein
MGGDCLMPYRRACALTLTLLRNGNSSGLGASPPVPGNAKRDGVLSVRKITEKVDGRG